MKARFLVALLLPALCCGCLGMEAKADKKIRHMNHQMMQLGQAVEAMRHAQDVQAAQVEKLVQVMAPPPQSVAQPGPAPVEDRPSYQVRRVSTDINDLPATMDRVMNVKTPWQATNMKVHKIYWVEHPDGTVRIVVLTWFQENLIAWWLPPCEDTADLRDAADVNALAQAYPYFFVYGPPEDFVPLGMIDNTMSYDILACDAYNFGLWTGFEHEPTPIQIISDPETMAEIYEQSTGVHATTAELGEHLNLRNLADMREALGPDLDAAKASTSDMFAKPLPYPPGKPAAKTGPVHSLRERIEAFRKAQAAQGGAAAGPTGP